MRPAIFLIVLVVLSASGFVDDRSQAYADAALKRALVTFAVARTLNGVISVAQGTDIAIEPAGLGVIVSAGEILDPVNDLIERFSAVMLLAVTSLGVQSVLLRMSGWWGMTVLLALAAALLLLVHLRKETGPPWLKSVAWRGLAAVVFLRFAVPLLVVINHLVFQAFLLPGQQEATRELEQTTVEIRQLDDAEPADPADAAEGGYAARMWQLFGEGLRSLAVERRMAALRDVLRRTTERVVDLIVVFVLQTVILPIAILWFMARILRLVVAGPP